MRIRTAAATAVLGASLALAGTTAAFAAQPAGEPSGGTGPNVEFVCENQALIQAAIDAGQAAAQARLDLLAAARADAEADGRTNVVARIDRRTERVEAHLARLGDREAKLAEIVAESCPAA